MNTDIPGSSGTSFRSNDDFVKILASGSETDGVFSLLEWTAADWKDRGQDRDYGIHRHNGIEETFFILEGSLCTSSDHMAPMGPFFKRHFLSATSPV